MPPSTNKPGVLLEVSPASSGDTLIPALSVGKPITVAFESTPEPEPEPPKPPPEPSTSSNAEPYAIRLQKLEQQEKAWQQKQKEQFTDDLFNAICNNLIKNLKQTPEEVKKGHESFYSVEVHKQYAEAFTKLHAIIERDATNNEIKHNKATDKLTINLKDNQEITVQNDKKHNRILFNAPANSQDDALVILIESALKAVKTVGKHDFIIYPGGTPEEIGKLCAMAAIVGLNPVFKEDPGVEDVAQRKKDLEEFNKMLKESELKSDDATEIANKNKGEYESQFNNDLKKQQQKPGT